MSIPDDILTIAGVVTGDDRTSLTGWQRRDAIAAMTALGYSGAHIAWALRTIQTSIAKTAALMGLTLHHRDQRLDWIAIAMVVEGDACLPLFHADRAEVVRQLAARRLTCAEIGRRLRVDPSEISYTARRLGITLAKEEQWSWYAYGTHRWQRQAVAA